MPVDLSIYRHPQNLGNLGESFMAGQQAAQQQAVQQDLSQLRQQQIQSGQAAEEDRQVVTAARRAQAADTSAVDELMRTSMITDPATGVATFDRQKFEQGLLQGGRGHLYPTLAGHLDALDATAEKRAGLTRTMAARAILGVQDAGNTPDALLGAMAYLKKNGGMGNEQIAPLLEALKADPSPEAIGAIMTKLGGQIPEYRELAQAEAKRKGEAEKLKAETAHVTAQTAKLAAETAVVGTPKGVPGSFEDYIGHYAAERHLTPAQLSTKDIEQARKAYQQADDRPPVSVNFADRPAPPGNWELTGDAFLKTIPQQWRATVEKIAHYDQDPTKVASMRSGMRETLSQWVSQVNPAYKADEFAVRAPMRRAFTSGPQGQTINSLNTAIEHLDQFVDVAKALNNGNFRPGNELYNWVKTTFGDSAPTNFDGIKTIMSGELAAAFKKSGATDQEIAAVQRAITSKNSPAQLMDYATKIAIPALGSKVASFDQQFKQVMGPDDTFKILLPNAEKVLRKHGFDPAHPTMGAVQPTAVPATGKISVTAPDGSVHPFDTQAQADAFKKLLAGAK